MTKTELTAALETLATKHTKTFSRKNGQKFVMVPTVRDVSPVKGMPGVAISVPCNAYVTQKQAVEVVRAIRNELAAMTGAAQTRRNVKLDIPGLWHMGSFSADCVVSRHYSMV